MCGFLGPLAAVLLLAGGEVGAFTLFKCIGPDGQVSYLDSQPKAGQCKTEEKKDLDPDANVIPAPDFVGGDTPDQPAQGTGGESGRASYGSSAPRPQSDDARLVTGASEDAAPPPAPITPGAPVAGGAPVAPAAPLPPAGVFGP